MKNLTKTAVLKRKEEWKTIEIDGYDATLCLNKIKAVLVQLNII
ncbi:hypothetical protein [Bacillus atrophaeus]|nr:hypothetical protein [Bacillus atrophaeus]